MKATERLSYERLTRMLEHHREQGRLEGERAEKERCTAIVRRRKNCRQPSSDVLGILREILAGAAHDDL